MDSISPGQFSLVYNAFSFAIAVMGAATVFFFLSRSQVAPPYRTAITVTGLVTLAEMYQEMGKVDDSISVYEDIAANSSNPDWKQAAIDRAKTLRSEVK